MGILKNLLVLGSAKFANVIKGTVEHAQNGIYFGSCTTAAATAAKVITLDDPTGFELKSGVMICVKFTNTNTASNATFNVQGTGAKSVSYAKNTAYAGTTSAIMGNSGYSIYYVYDGTYWCFLGNQNNYANNSDTYTSAYSSTAAGTAAKSASCSGYTATANTYVHIVFTQSNSAASALTLNINGKGAKPIYINGSASSSTNYTLPAGSYIAFYDGTNYHLRTDNKLPANITGTVNGHTVNKDVPSNAVFTDTTALTSMTGTLAIDHGGTGATTAAAARTNLGFSTVGDEGTPVYFNNGLPSPGAFTWGVDDDQNVQVGWDGDAPEIEIPTSTALPVSSGGTGATTAAEARTNLGLGSASTYNVVSSVQDDSNLVTNGAVYRYVNHTRTQLGLEGNLLSKTYTGIIGTANTVADASFYAIKVLPDDYNGEWSIRYRITAEITGVSEADGLGHQVSDLYIQGMRNTYATYWVWNDVRNTSYRPFYYNIFYRAKAAGVTNGYGHIIGVGLRDSYNRLTTANSRTITVEVLDYKDCTVSLFDSMVKYSNAPGTGSTNYEGYTELNGTTQGFTRSGSDANTYDRTYVYGAAIRAESAIVGGNIIVAGTNSYYHHLKLGTAFDTTYPILYANAAISANANSNSNTYISIPFTVTTTQTITLTAQSPVFIKGQLSGTIFTPVSTTPLTQTIPSTEDGYEYILLGQAYSTTQLVLAYDNPIFAYRNGKWRKISGDAELESMTGTLGAAHGGTGVTSIDALAELLMGKQIPSGTSLNSLTSPGIYYSNGSSFTDGPSSSTITLIVMKKAAQANQIVIDNNSNMFYRVMYTTGWQAWKKVTATTVS